MKTTGRASSRITWRSLVLLAFPFAAIGIAYYLLIPSVPVESVNPVEEASAALEAGDIKRAFQIVERLHRESPDSEVTYLLAVIEGLRGNNQRALQVIQELPDFARDPRLLTMAARFALDIPRLSVARKLLEDVVRVSPQNEEALRMLMGLEVNLLNTRRVRELIATLERLNVATAEDIFLYCSGNRVSYDLYENVKRLVPAYEEEPDQGEIAYALISNYLAMNRLKEAETVIETAVARQSMQQSWLIGLAEAELAIISEDFERAASALSGITKEGQQSSGFWTMLGRVLRHRKDYAQAERAYRNAAQLAPFDPDPVFAISRLLARTSPLEAAQLRQKTRLLQELSVQVESVVSLDSFEEAVERFPLIVEKLIDAGAWREAHVCLNWLQAEGYRSRDATVQMARLNQLVGATTSQLIRPSSSELLSVDFTALTGQVPTTEIVEDVVSFRDVTDALNVNFEYDSPADVETTILTSLGGGVGALDFDLDGHVDLFFPQAGPLPGDTDRSADVDCLLRRRQARFVDVSAVALSFPSDYGHGVASADVNEDGFPDLFVTNFGRNQLLINNGDGTFADVTVTAGLTEREWSVSAAFEDFDGDGDVDLYVVNYLSIAVKDMEACTDERSTPCGPLNVPACQDRLYENRADGTFRDITHESGIVVPNGKGLGVVIRDFDGDGRRDVFVGNDTTDNGLFYNESQDGKISFQENAVRSGVAVGGAGKPEACMGIASTDFDNNGFPDIFVTNFEGETNTYYANLGNRLFSDQTDVMELGRNSYTMMGWGAQFLDIDDDHLSDLVMLNGHLHREKMLPYILLQQDGRFHNPSSYTGDYFTEKWLGRALAVLDFNNDARPDLLATHRTGRPRVLMNQSGTQDRFTLRLIATASQRNALGATVTITVGDLEFSQVLSHEGGYLSANESVVAFAMPSTGIVDRLTIRWPSGHEQSLEDASFQGRINVVETQGSEIRLITTTE